MVLERLVSVREALRNPWWVLIIGAIISLVSVFLSYVIFTTSIGWFSVFFITFAMTPFMVNLMIFEEAQTEEEIEKRKEMNVLQRHKDMLVIYSAFFLGVVIMLILLYLFLPEPMVEKIFADQINKINEIRGISSVTGSFAFIKTYQTLVFNNMGVLLISFLFAFLFGSGAIFILSWNASVLAAAIGITAKSIGGLRGLPLAIMIYFPHGSLEILAYFIGGIAGGIVSASLVRRKAKYFKLVLKDSLSFLGVAIAILFFAAFIEMLSIGLAK